MAYLTSYCISIFRSCKLQVNVPIARVHFYQLSRYYCEIEQPHYSVYLKEKAFEDGCRYHPKITTACSCFYFQLLQKANERLKALNEERQKEKALLKKMRQCDSPSSCLNSTYNVSSYDMTPHVPKQFEPSTEENYNINDISSEDETDDEERPRKTVPKWAKGALLRSALIQQYYNSTPVKINKTFDFDLSKPLDLVDMFKTFKPRYNKRTSSAMWKSPVKDIGHVSFSEYCRAQK